MSESIGAWLVERGPDSIAWRGMLAAYHYLKSGPLCTFVENQCPASLALDPLPAHQRIHQHFGQKTGKK